MSDDAREAHEAFEAYGKRMSEIYHEAAVYWMNRAEAAERELARRRPTLIERMNEPYEPVDIEKARKWYAEAREWAEDNQGTLPAWLERLS